MPTCCPAAKATSMISGVSNRRISQQALDVLLHQRADVAQRHRERRRHPDHPEPARSAAGEEHAQQHRERRRFRAGGHERDDRSWRAFINVGRPDMERRRRHLEAQSDEHQPHCEVRQGGLLGLQEVRNVVDVGGSGGAVDHGHAVKEERSGEGAEQEILQRRLGAFGGAAAHSGQNVSRDRRNFQRDEDQHQFDGGRHQHHADGAEQNQGVILAAARICCTSRYSNEARMTTSAIISTTT